VYKHIIEDFRDDMGVTPKTLTVNWLLPCPVAAGSGGHHDIFIAANEMVKRGHNVTLYCEETNPKLGDALTRDFIKSNYNLDPLFDIERGFNKIRNCDAIICTHYTTVYKAEELWDRCYLQAYFIQDFEPFFSPIGSDYFLAEQTYSKNMFYITLGPWLKEKLANEYGVKAGHVDFWVDRNIYFPSSNEAGIGPSDRRRILYFARPHMPRRSYELGVMALEKLSKNIKDVDIVFFGSNDIDVTKLNFPCIDLGVLPVSELGELYRGADMALSFSTTNPSLAGFEMMACGLPIIDLDVLDSVHRHGDGYPAHLCTPTADTIAEDIEALVFDEKRLKEMSLAGIKFTTGLNRPQDALAKLTELIEERIGAS
jgi:glycosyltransferase involved in cell wall biosynthesis